MSCTRFSTGPERLIRRFERWLACGWGRPTTCSSGARKPATLTRWRSWRSLCLRPPGCHASTCCLPIARRTRTARWLRMLLRNSLLLAALLAVPSWGGALGTYRLLEHPANTCQSGSDCVPLVLIHGLHGTGSTGPCGLDAPVETDCNWSPFVARLSSRHPEMRSRLRVYVFRYIADHGDTVIDMGRHLRLLVNAERGLWERPFVIVAQSMGGLVARAFLQHQPHPFGPRGSLLVNTLITLATPHHGTPFANRILRNRLAERNTGRPASYFDLLDRFFWSLNSSPHLAHNAEAPNRSDLLWDGYDGLFAALREDLHAPFLEVNHSLAQLHGSAGARLVLYGGYLDFEAGPEPASQLSRFLRLSGRLLRSQLHKPWNDGLVPLDSALFLGYSGAAERRVFRGYDHSEMMGSRPRRQTELLDALVADIAAVERPHGPRPTPSSASSSRSGMPDLGVRRGPGGPPYSKQ